MTPEFGRAARGLVTGRPGHADTAQQVAERAAQTFERLAQHLARLLGDTGVELLVKRSVVISSAQFPWLALGPNPGRALPALREAMEQQDPESITEAFVAVLAAFVNLLERLIGETLVARLLDEVWPTVFSHEAKDTQ